ncbi:MAG: ParB/RepB/Spo0J family partition protein [Bacteroidota bacterium]
MSAKKKSALGRGLGALLSESAPIEREDFVQKRDSYVGINEISVDKIEANPFQPRSDFDMTALEELAESIKMQGIIQPITVRKLSDHKYQLIAGERRLQASKIAGVKSLPAYIRTANDQQMLEMAIIENIQREDLNAIEIALSYKRLMSECDLKQEEMADRVGKNRATVSNYLRLLKLPPDIQAAIRDKKLSMGHARAIINIENIDTQLTIFKKILKDDLSVRKVEGLAKLYSEGKPNTPERPKTSQDPTIHALETKLSSHFGTKVALTADSKNKGSIKIPFVSAQDLNRLLEILDISL